MRFAELLDRTAEAGGPVDLVEALLVGDDLLQRDALLSGRNEQAEPAVLTVEQVNGEQALPEYLASEGDDQAPRIAADAVWAAYFRHAADVASRRHSRFLGAWIAHEVALRNALTEARAKALGLEGADYVVAQSLAEKDGDFAAIISEWSAAPDPLEGLRVLDRHRWSWIGERDGWFTFGDDELAAYTAKLMLICRWHRLRQDEAETARQGTQTRND